MIHTVVITRQVSFSAAGKHADYRRRREALRGLPLRAGGRHGAAAAGRRQGSRAQNQVCFAVSKDYSTLYERVSLLGHQYIRSQRFFEKGKKV